LSLSYSTDLLIDPSCGMRVPWQAGQLGGSVQHPKTTEFVTKTYPQVSSNCSLCRLQGPLPEVPQRPSVYHPSSRLTRALAMSLLRVYVFFCYLDHDLPQVSNSSPSIRPACQTMALESKLCSPLGARSKRQFQLSWSYNRTVTMLRVHGRINRASFWQS